MCNGKLSVEDILNRLREENPKINTEEVVSILEWAEWNSVIQFFSTPDEVPLALRGPITLSGSKKFFAPLHLHIEVTSACNFRCKHCYRDVGTGKKGITIDVPKLKKALKILRAKGLKIVELTGGEPLLHPRLHQIIDFCTSNFEVTALLTNGFYVTREFVEALGPYPTQMTLIVGVSLYGTTPRTHDEFTEVPGSFKKAVRACRLIIKKKIPVRFNFSLSPQNLEEVKSLPKLAKRVGIPLIACSPILPFGRGAQINWSEVSTEKILTYIKESHQLVKTYPNLFHNLPFEGLRDSFLGVEHCGAGYRSFCLSPEGTVRPCVFVKPGLMDLGNIFDNKIEKVFSGPLVNVFSQINAPNKQSCAGCKNENFCLGCWYRGLLASRRVSGCRWEKRSLIYPHVDILSLDNLARETNLDTSLTRL